MASAATLTHGDAISFAIDDDKRQREKAVVRAAQGGDRSAFEELYKENLRRVYALAYRLTGNPSDAEELTQEAFIRAWQKLPSFRGDSAFSSWLYPLTVNAAYSEKRAKGRREARVMPVEDLTRLYIFRKADCDRRAITHRATMVMPPAVKMTFPGQSERTLKSLPVLAR